MSNTWIANYLPTFADDLGSFDPQSLVHVAWTDGHAGSQVDGVDILTNSVEGMLEATEGLKTARVSAVTNSRVEIDITCEIDDDSPMPISFTLVFEVTA